MTFADVRARADDKPPAIAEQESTGRVTVEPVKIVQVMAGPMDTVPASTDLENSDRPASSLSPVHSDPDSTGNYSGELAISLPKEMVLTGIPRLANSGHS